MRRWRGIRHALATNLKKLNLVCLKQYVLLEAVRPEDVEALINRLRFLSLEECLLAFGSWHAASAWHDAAPQTQRLSARSHRASAVTVPRGEYISKQLILDRIECWNVWFHVYIATG